MTLKNWISSNNIQFRRNNERPWGSYELAASMDGGVSWAMFPETFGYGINEIDAFERTLTKHQEDGIFKEHLSNWMGVDKSIELFESLIECETTPNTSVTLYTPIEDNFVHEHIYNESNPG